MRERRKKSCQFVLFMEVVNLMNSFNYMITSIYLYQRRNESQIFIWNELSEEKDKMLTLIFITINMHPFLSTVRLCSRLYRCILRHCSPKMTSNGGVFQLFHCVGQPHFLEHHMAVVYLRTSRHTVSSGQIACKIHLVIFTILL